MLDAIPPELITGGGLAGLVTIAVLYVLSGRLVPRSTVDSLLSGKDQQIARLEQAYGVEVERGRMQADHIGELLEYAKTTDQFIRSLPRPDRQEAL